jgi:CBS domain-containing protein
MQVRDVLKTKGGRVISIDPDASVSEAIARLVQNNIGSLPVVDGYGHLVGMFSERDALRCVHRKCEGFGPMPVSQVMSSDPVTCDINDDVNEIMGKMSERRIAKVPVLHDDKLVGIVSVGDVIKVLFERVSSENQHLLTYIHGAL